jgi:SAM-dependent methyltransferase
MRSLLLGCGLTRQKLLHVTGEETGWGDLTTLDIDPDNRPDVVHDLNALPLPFADNSFDEIHAYEVLEHIGRQGDWQFFFAQFDDLWRILKPGGWLCCTVPWWQERWAWGDPGHTRIIQPETICFLSRPRYDSNIYHGKFSCDFDIPHMERRDVRFLFSMQAVKPARPFPARKIEDVNGHLRRNENPNCTGDAPV